MATIGTGVPLLYVEGSATQTGGSGTQRTVKITAKFKVNGSSSSSWYGYACNWRARVHGSYGSWTAIKGTESWNATQSLRTFEQTLTVDVGTTSSTNITVGIYTDSQIDSGWDGSYTWTFGVGSTNTAPYFTGGEQWLRIRNGDSNGAILSGVIPENVSNLYLDWGYASDNEGGTINYSLNHNVNNGGWSRIDWGTDRAHSYGIGSGNEGETRQFYVDAQDNGGLWSGKVYSETITKNRLTSGGFTGHSNDIAFNTKDFTLYFGGGSNSNGSGVTYTCYSDTVVVYNQTETIEGSQVISIWRNGEPMPIGPYIKFDDLKSFFATSEYNGRLHVGLRTRNSYGTDKWAGGSVGVDLRINPPAPSNPIIASSSTIWKTVETTGKKYLVPDGSGRASIDWQMVTGNLGEAITYEVYVAYGDGGWSYLGAPTGTNNNTAYYHHHIAKQTISQQVRYLIRAKTSYGYYTDATTQPETLHFYNNPSLIQGAIVRGATSADIKITVKANTSIPEIGVSGSWLTTPSTTTGNLINSQDEQSISLTGLTDEGTYALKITYNDSTGFISNRQATISIGQNSPIFFVNKYGAGVGGIKAGDKQSFVVKGAIGEDGGIVYDFDAALTEGKFQFNDSTINGPLVGTYGRLVVYVNDGSTHNNSNNWIWQFAYLTQNGGTYTRNKTNSMDWSSWTKVIDSSVFNPNGLNVMQVNSSAYNLSGYKNWDTGNFDSTGGGAAIVNDNGSYKNLMILGNRSGGGDREIGLWDNVTVSGNIAASGSNGVSANRIEIKGTNAFFNKDTLRLEKGYSGNNYSQIMFKGQDNDDGRIIHYEKSNSSQLWLIPSDDNSTGDEVIIGSISGKNGETNFDGGTWSSAFTFKTDSTLVINSKSNSTDLNGLYNESVCLTSDRAPNRPRDWCFIRTFGTHDGYTMQLASYYGNEHQYYIRSQQDTSKNWKVWARLVISDHNNIYALRNANSYMHVESSSGAKGIDWWNSDLKFKDSVEQLSERKKEGSKLGLDMINKIIHYSFDYNKENGGEHVNCGYISQQLEKINSQLIIRVEQSESSPYYSKNDKFILQPKASAIIPYLSKAIQELDAENKALKEDIAKIKEKLGIN